MFRYILYPLFGVAVLAAYALSAAAGVDVSSVDTERTRMPATLAGQPAEYGSAPVIWRTAFHGPAAAPRETRGGGGGGFYVGTGGGFSGGFGGK